MCGATPFLPQDSRRRRRRRACQSLLMTSIMLGLVFVTNSIGHSGRSAFPTDAVRIRRGEVTLKDILILFSPAFFTIHSRFMSMPLKLIRREVTICLFLNTALSFLKNYLTQHFKLFFEINQFHLFLKEEGKSIFFFIYFFLKKSGKKKKKKRPLFSLLKEITFSDGLLMITVKNQRINLFISWWHLQ